MIAIFFVQHAVDHKLKAFADLFKSIKSTMSQAHLIVIIADISLHYFTDYTFKVDNRYQIGSTGLSTPKINSFTLEFIYSISLWPQKLIIIDSWSPIIYRYFVF